VICHGCRCGSGALVHRLCAIQNGVGACGRIAARIPCDRRAIDAPGVAIMLHAGPMAGHNLHVMTENFAFAPENASLENTAGEGHAHVYVNGAKLGRLYGAWMHLDALPKGEVKITVTLNSNDHRPLSVAGEPAAATQIITVK